MFPTDQRGSPGLALFHPVPLSSTPDPNSTPADERDLAGSPGPDRELVRDSLALQAQAARPLGLPIAAAPDPAILPASSSSGDRSEPSGIYPEIAPAAKTLGIASVVSCDAPGKSPLLILCIRRREGCRPDPGDPGRTWPAAVPRTARIRRIVSGALVQPASTAGVLYLGRGALRLAGEGPIPDGLEKVRIVDLRPLTRVSGAWDDGSESVCGAHASLWSARFPGCGDVSRQPQEE